MCLKRRLVERLSHGAHKGDTHLATTITPDIWMKRALLGPVGKRRARRLGGRLGAAWEIWDDGCGAASPKALIDELVHERVAISALKVGEEGVQEVLHLSLALVDAAARGLLGGGGSREFRGRSRAGKDRLELAAENDLGSGAVRAVICDCSGPVAIVLGDVADDDARRRPEVDHSVATINPSETLEKLCARISVSERRDDGDGHQLHHLTTHLVMENEEIGKRLEGQTLGLVLVCDFEEIRHTRNVVVGGQVPNPDPAGILSLTTWYRS